MNATIIRSELSDAAEILALQRLAFRIEAKRYGDFSIPPLMQTLEEMEDDIRTQVVLKALYGKRIIGSVRAYQEEGDCHVGRLVAHPEYHNMGLGTALLHEIEKHFPTAKRFALIAGHRSERNIHLYEKLGYGIYKTEVISDRLSIVYMEKLVEVV